MNIIKIKSMVISGKKPVPNISISVEGKPIQQLKRMVYLGYMATVFIRKMENVTKKLKEE